jgi:hypothetical protein
MFPVTWIDTIILAQISKFQRFLFIKISRIFFLAYDILVRSARINECPA